MNKHFILILLLFICLFDPIYSTNSTLFDEYGNVNKSSNNYESYINRLYDKNIYEFDFYIEVVNQTIWCEDRNSIEFYGGIIKNLEYNNKTKKCIGNFYIDKNKDFSQIIAVSEIRKNDKEYYTKECNRKVKEINEENNIIYRFNIFLILICVSFVFYEIYRYIDNNSIIIIGGKE